MVAVGDGRGVNVSVMGAIVGAGLSGVAEVGSSVGVGTAHAEKIIINKTNDKILSRACINLI